MFPLSTPLRAVAVSAIVVFFSAGPPLVHARCRNQPGDPGYPSPVEWSALNGSIDGRLVNVVPSAKACAELGCTEAQWESGIFRQTIPGSMNAVSILTWPVLSPNDLFAPVVQLGTGDAFPTLVPVLLIEPQRDGRIMALHLSSVYRMAVAVRREMSLFMRSTPHLHPIFRFMNSPARQRQLFTSF
jgi:hypothetical protein